MTAQRRDNWRGALTTHVGDPEEVLTAARRAETSTDLIVLPEQLHKRNLKRQLARQNQPYSSLCFRSLAAIASDVIQTTASSPDPLDRIDRIRHIERFVDQNAKALTPFERLFGSHLEDQAPTIEAIRSTVEAITGYTDRRLQALSAVTDQCPQPAEADGADYINGAIRIQQALTDATASRVSTDTVLIDAARRLRYADDAFQDTYPGIERLHIAGISAIRAPLLELLQAIAVATTVEIHLYLRRGTGPRLAAFLEGESGTGSQHRQPCELQTQTPATELVATTRGQEARAAIALIDQLRVAGVSQNDIVIAARSADNYEQPLRRAATSYGHPISVWSQLPVTDTRPYQLLDICCQLLARYAADKPIAVNTLRAALSLGWVEPNTTSWQPLAPDETNLDSVIGTDKSQTVSDVKEAVQGAAKAPKQYSNLLSWIAEPREPDPETVRTAFGPILDRYRDVVIPGYRKHKDITQRTLTQLARAHERVEALVDEVADKYAHWLTTEQTDQSWETVRSLMDTKATITPGRRDHTDGAVVDVIDGTDAWLRDVPVVIAMGLVDGEWPQNPGGYLPPEIQARISTDTSPAAQQLPARAQWGQARGYDHFADTVSMATHHLICTRSQQTSVGTSTHRSPLLDQIPTTTVDIPTTTDLCRDVTTLPPPLVHMIQTAPGSEHPVNRGGGV